jgi:signal transduction histidine kinase/integral membrane sensor domain MASE1/ActR/RegA family two-component response regulator
VRPPQGLFGWLAALVLVGGAYVVAGKLGLSLAFFHVSASPVWPPTGIAIAALLLLGMRVWPAIFVGAFVVNVTTAGSVATSIGIAAGNTLEGMAAAALTNRFAGGRRVFERLRGVFLFTALAGALSAGLSATVGVTTLTLAGYADRSQYGAVWLTWWLGDVGGALVLAPLLVLWAAGSGLVWTWKRAWEAAALGLAVLFAGLMVFTGIGPEAIRNQPIAFMTVPLPLWAAFRFGPREAATAMVLLSTIAIWGTLEGVGQFAVGDPNRSLLLLQAFLATVSVTTLAAAAVVAERRRAQHALHGSELAYRELFASNPHPMWIVDAETQRFLAVNEAAVHKYGYGRGELLGMRDRDLHTGGNGEARHLAKDGRLFDVEITAHPIRFQNRPASLVLAYDITDRLRGEEERRRLLEGEQTARQEAEQANLAKDSFLAILSHELRTPLTAILGWARMLQGGKLGPTQVTHALETIERNVRRQTQLINDLLDISRIVSGKLSLNSHRVDLAPIVEESVETLRREGEGKHLQLHTHVEPGVGRVFGDPVRLHQVIVNLVANAVKFTPDGGHVEVVLRQIDDQACVVVRDSGKGIAPELLPHIFERFRQADTSLTRRHGGLGLGLAIVRELVHLHGGTVAAESPGDGRGASFQVRLPLAGVTEGVALGPRAGRSAADARSGTAPSLIGARVLIVDDDPDTLDLLATTLGVRQAGAIVATARSVLEGLKAFERLGPDLVVTDLAMPEQDGYVLLREVQARAESQGRTIPIVAITAHAGAGDRERALAAGFAAYLSKPLEPTELVRVLTRAAAQAKAAGPDPA